VLLDFQPAELMISVGPTAYSKTRFVACGAREMNYPKALSGLLILVTVGMSAKNSFSHLRDEVAFREMVVRLHVTSALMNALILATLLSALLLLAPRTMLIGCFTQIACFLLVAAVQLRTGNIRGALIEMPFVAMVAVIAYLGHPFAR
jgi:hypothetical protein